MTNQAITDNQPTDFLRKIQGWSGWGAALPVILLIVLYAGIATMSPGFLSIYSLQTVATLAAPLIFLATGLTPIIMLGGIDLSLAAMTSLTSILIVQFLPSAGVGGLLLALGIATAFGALVGFVHAFAQIPSFVVTLGALGLYGGMALQISGANNEPLTDHAELVSWVTLTVGPLPVGFLVAVAFALLIAGAMKSIPIGRYTYAVGSNEAAALMSGVRSRPLRVGLFALAGLSAGLAAVLLVGGTQYASPSLAGTYLLPTIAAVVVGGTAISGGIGGPLRSLVGALIISLFQVGLVVVGINPVLQNVVFGAIIVVAVALTTDRTKLLSIK